MGMFSRVTSIFKSNVNTMLEKMEDPSKMLDQNIRDMESEYVKAKESVSRAKAEEINLSRKINVLNTEALKWTENAKLALTKGNEDLAKKALLKKQEIENELFLIKEDSENISKSTQTLVSDLKIMENKIAEAKRKKNLLKTRLETASAKKKIVETKAKIEGIGEGAFSSFSKMEEKANRLINEADALEEINDTLSGSNLESEFEKLNDNKGIDDELEKLKAQL